MVPTIIHAAPALDTFTPLAEHQSQTPATFYNAKPVLHYHATGVRALASQDQLAKLPVFTQAVNDLSPVSEADRSLKVELVDAYIGSEQVPSFT
jgi:nucleotide-sensitive chloride channel 1A